jgi:hypothetical protein
MTRLVVCAAVSLFLTLPLRAAGEPKANTLTPQEIADGWLLLFDGETTFGWHIDGEAKVENGTLILGGSKATRAATTTAFVTETADLELHARWDGMESPTFQIAFWLQGEKLPDSAKEKFVVQRVRHTTPPIAEGSAIVPRPWAFEVPAGSKLFLRNVKIRPLNLKPIFNGKDLSGWKRFDQAPRDKSQFTVEDGVLRLRNGPGDLQTEAKWADFVLQLECKCNGKHLNSGVFFRCRPGEYQQGYEAQIHNAFTDEPAKEYTLDVYDPETHELKEKKKVKYTAVDYGTGAIYRRQPARQQVARDFEWFTMTVIAQGRHIGVWVNGILVTDWTDNRPPRDNAREGCRLEAGPISLQGHDPTTDLSFRNLRIAELPRK